MKDTLSDCPGMIAFPHFANPLPGSWIPQVVFEGDVMGVITGHVFPCVESRLCFLMTAPKTFWDCLLDHILESLWERPLHCFGGGLGPFSCHFVTSPFSDQS